MTDIVDSATRSRMMSGIRSKNTKPELLIRKRLHAMGFRYRIHDSKVFGKPDIVLSRYKAVILINGCFWHGHNCPLFKLPATQPEFWKEKISRNRERDAVVRKELDSQGWRQLTVWECAFRGKGKIGFDESMQRIRNWIISDAPAAEVTGDLSGSN
jgi:DNA mismatch endonuclease, patch repair protein